MTLRKKDEDVQPEFDPAEVMRMEKFIEKIKGLATYLGQFDKEEYTGRGYCKGEKVKNIQDFDKYVLRKDARSSAWDDCFICVAAGRGQSQNKYVHNVVKYAFPLHKEWRDFHGEALKTADYNCNLTDYEYGEFNTVPQRVWRDDIVCDVSGKDLMHGGTIEPDTWITHVINYFTKSSWENKKYYNVFWNLFLTALDEDIYEKQSSMVIELAYYLDFDEPMLRDWCRAVEYVMSGKKLSSDCDLECETVEGARFFLHKEE